MTLRASGIITRQSRQHGRPRKRIGLIITNGQNMYTCGFSLYLQYLTPLTTSVYHF